MSACSIKFRLSNLNVIKISSFDYIELIVCGDVEVVLLIGGSKKIRFVEVVDGFEEFY
jgi:hypothetical protein